MRSKRIIALVDCDSFFVSCEQKANPELKGKPVCVLSNKDGCVISRSREAKKMGITMGMPYFMAKKDYPKAIYVSSRHDFYGEVSKEVMAVLNEFSPDVEVYSVDEAFIDLTGLRRLYKRNYYDLALYIKEVIKERVDIPVSIGVSSSKSLAKLASDKAKNSDDGIYVIGSRKIISELKHTDISEIWGIGRNLTALMHKNGILNAYELVSQTDGWIDKKIGIRGLEMKHELLGECVSPVVNGVKLPKSIQKTSAFGKFTSDLTYIKNALNYHIHRACAKLRRIDARCSTVSVMLRTKDFRVFYEKRVLVNSTCYEMEISDIAFELLEKIYNPNILYRSTGIILDNISYNSGEQLFLFANSDLDEKKDRLAKCIDKLENKFGKDIVQTGFVKDCSA